MPTSAVETGNETLDADLERLAQLGYSVETLVAGVEIGIVVKNLQLPAGYNCAQTDVLLKTTMLYPASAMDMFWVSPTLLLAAGGVPQAGDSMESHFGLTWRRYSWHRNTEWRPGRDDVVSHFDFALARLQRPV
jgi:hypothetical protein